MWSQNSYQKFITWWEEKKSSFGQQGQISIESATKILKKERGDDRWAFIVLPMKMQFLSLYFKDEIKISSVILKIPQQLAVPIPKILNKWCSHYSTCLFFVDKFQHLYLSSNYFWPCDVAPCENNPVLEFPRKWLQSISELCWAGVSDHSGSAGNGSHPFTPPQPSCSPGHLFLGLLMRINSCHKCLLANLHGE